MVHFNVEEGPVIHCGIVWVFYLFDIILVAFNPPAREGDGEGTDLLADVIDEIKVWALNPWVPRVDDR
jgi:hypothetical protein